MFLNPVDQARRVPPEPTRRRIVARLLRPFKLFLKASHIVRGPFGLRHAASFEDELTRDEAALFAPNTTGIPEASLTEDERREALRRTRSKPRIG